MVQKIHKISSFDAAKVTLELFENNQTTMPKGGSNPPTLPIIMGAGVSASAGVPLNKDLLSAISMPSKPDTSASYEHIYDELRGRFAEGYGSESFFKGDLRHWLQKGGIPRANQLPLPNIGNLLTMHLLLNNFLGPIINLNIDPLLQISAGFFSTKNLRGLQYIQNTSQFSDLLETAATGNRFIYQPHGTIEEPSSLRFIKSELFDKKNELLNVLVNAVADRVGIVSVGVNFVDGVASKFISEWMDRNRSRQLTFLATMHKQITKEEEIQLNKVADQHPTCKILVGEGVDSDRYWQAVAELAVQKSLEYRSESKSLYHVPAFTGILAQRQLFNSMSKQHKRRVQNSSQDVLPSIEDRLAIEICMHAVTCRGPFSVGDLVKHCAGISGFISTFNEFDGLREFGNAVSRVFNQHLIALYEHDGKRISDVDIKNYDSIDDIESILIRRSSKYSSIEQYVHAIYTMLNLNANKVENMSELIKNLELEREVGFDYSMSIPSSLYFEESEVIGSHYDLDHQLDQLKDVFKNAVERNESIECCVITESGEHLFRKDILSGMSSVVDLERYELSELVRDWLVPLIRRPSGSQQKLRVIVAKSDPGWLFEHADRAEREEMIRVLLERLGAAIQIDVRSLAWENHNDHMWVIRFGTGKGSEGVLFPRRHGEQTYFGLHVQGEENVNKLIRVFDRHSRDSLPLNSGKIHHVAAVTIVDKTHGTGDELFATDRILLGVRSPESNGQHANVACVPTKRIPFAAFNDIVGSRFSISSGNSTTETLGIGWVDNHLHPGHEVITDIVENIFCRKLDLASALERGDISYRASPRVVKAGHSPLLSEQDKAEFVVMLNILVFIDRGIEHFPTKSVSYDRLEWVSVEKFLDAIDGKEHGIISLGSGDDSATYICGGVCVCTTDLLIASLKTHY